MFKHLQAIYVNIEFWEVTVNVCVENDPLARCRHNDDKT